MRTLAITQNVTLDGAIEMLDDWFDAQGQAVVDNDDLMAEMHPQDAEADSLLVGRQTFEDLRGYWPTLTDDATGVTDYLNRVQKYVVSSTMSDPAWQNSEVLPRRLLARRAARASRHDVPHRHHTPALRGAVNRNRTNARKGTRAT